MADGFIYRIGSPTCSIGRPPKFYRTNLLRSSGSSFASVYAVRKEDAEAIQETAQTAAGFKGVVWSSRLWVDFDTEEGAIQARSLLTKGGYDYVEYTTGGRGAHFGIARDAKPSHVLPALDKQWVKENLAGADLSLYWHLHLIRLPGTVHERTGRTKALVSRQSGKALVLHNIPSFEDEYRPSPMHKGRQSSIFNVWQVASNLTGSGVNGSRHKQLRDLSLALKSEANVTLDEARWIVLEVNRGFNEPKPEEEVEKLIKWVYEKD